VASDAWLCSLVGGCDAGLGLFRWVVCLFVFCDVDCGVDLCVGVVFGGVGLVVWVVCSSDGQKCERVCGPGSCWWGGNDM